MKRFLACTLCLATVLSSAAFSTSAEAPAQQTNSDVEALAFASAPTLDGVITEDEWGAYTVEIDSATANNDASTTYSAFNSYFYNDTANPLADNLHYKLWLRWDAENFYLGAVIDDPDGYNVPAGRASIWDADCLQFRLDPVGPNSIMTPDYPDYDYKTTGFDVETYSSPWLYGANICNIGIADVGKTKLKQQVIDMQNGNIALNDGKSVPEGQGATLGIISANADNGNKTTIEVSIPWAYFADFLSSTELSYKLDANGKTNQFYVGKTIGFSCVVLDSVAGNTRFDSFLAWGTGICGHQWDKKKNPAYLVDNGGSNAVVLSDKNAVDPSKTVADLPQKPSDDGPVEHVEQALYSAMDEGTNYYGLGTKLEIDKEAWSFAYDVCILDTNVQDETKSLTGVYFGQSYQVAAVYDYSTQSFMFCRHNWGNGVNRDAIYKQSAKFEWLKSDKDNGVAGTWHNIGIQVDGQTARMYCDGILVLEDTNPVYSQIGEWKDSTKPAEFTVYTEAEIEQAKLEQGEEFNACKELILYNSVEALFDNLTLAGLDYDFIKRTGDSIRVCYNVDTDDEEYKLSGTRRQNSTNPQVTLMCNSAENEQEYLAGHEFIYESSTATEVTFVCDCCGEKKTVTNDGSYPADGPAAVPGDTNGDGSINAKDVSALLKALAGSAPANFVEANADVNVDGKVNAKDASKLLKDLAAK